MISSSRKNIRSYFLENILNSLNKNNNKKFLFLFNFYYDNNYLDINQSLLEDSLKKYISLLLKVDLIILSKNNYKNPLLFKDSVIDVLIHKKYKNVLFNKNFNMNTSSISSFSSNVKNKDILLVVSQDNNKLKYISSSYSSLMILDIYINTVSQDCNSINFYYLSKDDNLNLIFPNLNIKEEYVFNNQNNLLKKFGLVKYDISLSKSNYKNLSKKEKLDLKVSTYYNKNYYNIVS